MFRKLIRKLNNFKVTGIISAIISGVAAVYALISFFMFHFAGDLVPGKPYARQVGFYDRVNAAGDPIGGYLSFIVFLGFIVTLICGIVVAYSMKPFIQNKEKLVPRKGILLAGFIGGVFELVLVVMMIMLLGEAPKTSVGIIISLPFGILSAIGQLCFLLPYLKCNFFMPEVIHK